MEIKIFIRTYSHFFLVHTNFRNGGISLIASTDNQDTVNRGSTKLFLIIIYLIYTRYYTSIGTILSILIYYTY